MDQKPNARKRAQLKHEKGDETEHNYHEKGKRKSANKQTNKLDDGQPSRASEQQTEGRPQKQLLHWKEKHKHARTHTNRQENCPSANDYVHDTHTHTTTASQLT